MGIFARLFVCKKTILYHVFLIKEIKIKHSLLWKLQVFFGELIIKSNYGGGGGSVYLKSCFTLKVIYFPDVADAPPKCPFFPCLCLKRIRFSTTFTSYDGPKVEYHDSSSVFMWNSVNNITPVVKGAKLQNTPQLIYMCREALKIEA